MHLASPHEQFGQGRVVRCVPFITNLTETSSSFALLPDDIITETSNLSTVYFAVSFILSYVTPFENFFRLGCSRSRRRAQQSDHQKVEGPHGLKKLKWFCQNIFSAIYCFDLNKLSVLNFRSLNSRRSIFGKNSFFWSNIIQVLFRITTPKTSHDFICHFLTNLRHNKMRIFLSFTSEMLTVAEF